MDAILVAGGGVREGGELPTWVVNRLDYAAQHYEGKPVICLSAGTTHRPPPLDSSGFPIFESVAAARYLVQQGIAPHQILIEASSYDTVGNAYFALMLHIIPRQFKHLLIVTSQFHMPRTQAIFEWVLGLEGLPFTCELAFYAVEDQGLDMDALAARQLKEQSSLEALQPLISRIRTLDALHRWLFTEHRAYAVTLESSSPPSPDLLQTY